MTDTTILTAPTRPRNAAATRAAILESARARFLVESFDQVGVRQIAGDVGVDAALICRYFGSKEELFAEVVATTCDDPMEVLAGDRSTFGSRVAKAMLDPEQRSHRESVDFINLAVRSTMSAAAGERVRDHIEQRFTMPFSQWLGGSDSVEKAWLTASVMMGVAIMRSIVCDPSAATEPKEATIARLAAVLQGIVDSA
jgi:AcrR family transcriptional regulator